MPFFLRAFSALNGAREWFSFARETFSWFGLAKRTAAVATVAAAGAAVVAVPRVMTSDSAAPADQVADSTPAAVEIDTNRIYSKLYLTQPQHRAMLDAIIAKCADGAEISVGQCDIAEAARRVVRMQEQDAAMLAAFSRARAEQKAANATPLKLPHEIQIVR